MVTVSEKLHPAFKTGKEMHRRLNGTAGGELRAAFHKASNAAEPIDPKAQVRHQTLKSLWLFPPPPVEPPVRYSRIGGLRHRAG
jgi:hypothetical protein